MATKLWDADVAAVFAVEYLGRRYILLYAS